ncbi:spermine/spermidine N-acetyltransferase [Aquimarina sp. MAR_2010_214]|uniref:GNAT family N-acetyltransferase n=1 Tax=Aquimarina sp. MAR_2010_214 TaxID=1250026 RepID=UPI000C7003F2|nr:GNAT family N-acetyltransferase [Aquimarina sp. MAR_2010_214]PKV51050.1 spermine/spermidine N-acetyltransferase [Aquimarina sp. MAR_2010_214]
MILKEVQIKTVQSNDIYKLLDIGRQTFYDAFGPPHNTEKNINEYLNKKFTLDNITKELHNPNSEFYFAWVNNQIAGYIKLNSGNAQTEPLEGNTLEIERIYVVKEHQGKKIGQLLFQKTLQIAKEKSIEFIWLGVWEKNPRAITFYKRNGFKIFDTHQFMLGTDLQTDMMMKLAL